MGALESNTTLIYGIHLRESANDGSDFSNGATDYRVLFLGEDGLLHLKDSAGTVTDIGGSAGSVATDAIWDAAGDLAVGSGANTAAKLTIGAAGGALSRINGAVAWNSGTSNPGSAAAGDRYWRTDLGLEVYYDGTRWLTTQVFQIELKHEDSATATWPITADTIPAHRGTPTFGGTYDLYLLTWESNSSVAATNNGTNYWTNHVYKYNSAAGGDTSIASFNTSADTAGTVYNKSVTINALLGAYVGFYTYAIKTLSPGASKFHGGHIRCRAVIT